MAFIKIAKRMGLRVSRPPSRKTVPLVAGTEKNNKNYDKEEVVF